MRWNVVIGGQLISKSFRGLNTFTPPLLGEGGILATAAILLVPFALFAIMVYFIPPWQSEVKVDPPTRALGWKSLSEKYERGEL